MAVLQETVLERMAGAEADKLMKRLVVGETTHEVDRGTLVWNPTFRRHVFRQSQVIWRDFDAVQMILSEDGKRVLAFRDENRLKGGKFRRQTQADLLEIARTTGLVDARARLDDVKPGDLYRFTVRQTAPGKPARIAFTVNPTRRQVAAFEVLEESP
jgi:hypothetical protein